eukprot:scaffold3181_cov389-Prasinococcus_capsulatus_cf.AAC.13
MEGGNESKSEAELWEYLKMLNDEETNNIFNGTNTSPSNSGATGPPAHQVSMERNTAVAGFSNVNKSMFEQGTMNQAMKLETTGNSPREGSAPRSRQARDQDTRRKQIAHASKRYRQKKNTEYQHLKEAVQTLTERVKQLEVEKEEKDKLLKKYDEVQKEQVMVAAHSTPTPKLRSLEEAERLHQHYYERVKDLIIMLKDLVGEHETKVSSMSEGDRKRYAEALINQTPSPALVDAVENVQNLCMQWHQLLDEDSFHYKMLACSSLKKKLEDLGAFSEITGEEMYDRLCLQEHQIAIILKARNKLQEEWAAVYLRRSQLNVAVTSHLIGNSTGLREDHKTGQKCEDAAKAAILLDQLKNNFREEVWFQRDFGFEIFKSLSPVQKAILFIHALPNHPALLDLANIVVQRHGDGKSSALTPL